MPSFLFVCMLGPLAVVEWLTTIAQEIALWGGVLHLLASVLAFYQGSKQRELSSLVTETPRSDITEVRSPGMVRIRGRIVPQTDQETFVSPIKGDENCVLSAWEIKEMYDTPKTKSWERSAWGVTAVPFYLSDGTGEVLVDIDAEVVGNETDDVFSPETLLVSEGVSIEGLQCEFEEFAVHVETGYEDSPPRRVTDFLQTTDGISVEPMVTALGDHVVDKSKRKYLEQTLRPGDRISILGYVTPRHEGMGSTSHPDDLVLTQSAEGTLYLSERSFDEIADGGGALIFGVLTGIVGIGLLGLKFVF